ncbi:MAG TPA: hypothetical protein PLK99_04475, partial [Burkholderiales bacterium]|nr:hypothetical protein [Burkholderiales bacterium]
MNCSTGYEREEDGRRLAELSGVLARISRHAGFSAGDLRKPAARMGSPPARFLRQKTVVTMAPMVAADEFVVRAVAEDEAAGPPAPQDVSATRHAIAKAIYEMAFRFMLILLPGLQRLANAADAVAYPLNQKGLARIDRKHV